MKRRTVWMAGISILVAILIQRPWFAEAGDGEWLPGPDWSEAPSPLASPHAVPGGRINIYAGQYPKSFNYYLDNNTFTAELFGAMYETLLGRNPVTLEDEPGLARRWRVSDDLRTFTFEIDPAARWSDGHPVTAHDVRWTYDAIMHPENLTGVHKVALENFDSPEVIDDYTIRFTANSVHWRNLMACAGFHVLPRHALEGVDFNRMHFEFPVVSGPYRLGPVVEGRSVALERRSDWWQRESPRTRGTGNFQTLVFRFFASRDTAFEAFVKGDVDLFPVYTARVWEEDARGERYDNHWIVKQAVYNRQPIGFQGFAMNMRRAPFKDVRIRRALAHLLDRRKMNRTLMYNQYFMHRSYYEDLHAETGEGAGELLEFDPVRARELLDQAGWAVNSQTGLREKDGESLRVRFLTRDIMTDRFLAIYAEDLRDAGIELRIDRKDWAGWSRDMDEFNYDMTWAAWSAGVFKDPEGMWHSREAARIGGNNYTGFQDPRVDELIERQKTIFDVSERHHLVREIDRLIAGQVPYVLLWYTNATRLLYWNRFGTPPWVLSKYGRENSAYWYWWFDQDIDSELRESMEQRLSLPPRPAEVRFDDVRTGTDME